VRIKDLRLGEDVPDEEKQIDVKVADLADVRGVLTRWADAKAMKNLKL
jgi:hypothetical protein